MRRLIVIGASHGGVAALRAIFAAWQCTPAVPILIVQHIGEHISTLPELLSQARHPVAHAQQGDRLAPGRVLVAPPDHHLIVEDDIVFLSRSAKEHHTRPAIDPLFRSAALVHGPGVIGVVLTGRLDDGTAGLQAIKRLGGIAVVQDPRDAISPEMPESALQHCEVDHCVSIAKMAPLLLRLAQEELPAEATDPAHWEQRRRRADMAEVHHELELNLGRGKPMEHLEAIGTPSAFSCPDCHGGLWEVTGSQPTRYRCHTGHGYTESTLRMALGDMADEALWSALRALQEQQVLLDQMARRQRDAQLPVAAAALEQAARVLERQADDLRRTVVEGQAGSAAPEATRPTH